MTKAAAKGLGKGLSALMGEEYGSSASMEVVQTEESKEGLTQLLVANVHSGEFQPRVHFDETYLHELADSIEKNGVMQPIVVRPSPKYDGQYEIIAGERRWRASKLAEIGTIPAIIRDIDNKLALELALVENIQRQDLNVLEEAAGYQRLIDEFSYTQEALAHTVGKSRSHIANLLRLLALPAPVQDHVREGRLSMGHARALLGADNAESLAKTVLLRDLNVRQTEALVRGDDPDAAKAKAGSGAPKGQGKSSANRQVEKDADIISLEEMLSENLGLAVSIEDNGDQSGNMIIRYTSLIQLDEILQRLGDGA